MQFKIIVATCKNNGIGCNDALPWNIKEDLKHFSKTTKGNGNNAIIMGKNTWNSIGCRCLPKRDSLVLSRSLESVDDYDAKFFKNVESLKIWCLERNYEDIWIIGGESVYKQFIDEPQTNEVVITKIDQEFECDTFFPELSEKIWQKTSQELMKTSQIYNVVIEHYKRV